MQRLSALDATFLEVEDAVSHMHIASIALFEGPPPEPEQLRAMVLAKLPLVPRYRQVVRFVPFSAGRPVWVDDPHFNLEYHLRRTGLPAPGCEQQLHMMIGRVMSQQLDRGKPLWEMWVVEGLELPGEPDGWALISKVHHCMVDGVAGADLLSVMLDPHPTRRAPRRRAGRPPPPPGEASCSRAPSPLLPCARSRRCGGLRAPRALAERGSDAARGLMRMREVAGPTRRLLAERARSAHTGAGRCARAQLADVRQVKATLGGTVNDIVLACITGGFRDLLHARHESVRAHDSHDGAGVGPHSPPSTAHYDNRVSAIFAELPVGIADPVARLDSIRAQMADLKASQEADAGEVLTSLAGFAPPLLLALAERARHARAPAQHEHRHHQRARTAAAAVRGRQAHARGVRVRSARRALARSAWRSSPTTGISASA